MAIFKIKKNHPLKSISEYDYFSSDHLNTDLKNKAIKGSGITVFSQIVIYSIEMVCTIVLARILTPDDFGLVAMVTTILWFFMMYRNLGLVDATIQRENINHQQISTLFWINAAFGVTLTIIFIALAPAIAWFYKEPQLKSIAIVLALVFFFGGWSTQHQALLKRNMLFFRSSANLIIASVISVVVAIALALNGWGYWALIVRRLVLALVTTVGAWIFCQWRPGLPSFNTEIKSLLNFGKNIVGNSSLNYLSRYFDKILIGWFDGAKSLGYYDKAYQLFMAPSQQLSFPLTHVAVAALSRLSNEPAQYQRYYLNAISMLTFIAMPISIVLTIAGKDIILLLLGSQWEKTGILFSVFGLGVGTQMLYGTNAWIHISLGKTDRLVRWSIVGSIVTIIFFLFGLPFGSFGIAVAYISAIHILIGPCLKYACKPIGLNLSTIMSNIWKYYLAAILGGLLSWFLLNIFDFTSSIFLEFNIFLRLLLSIVICICAYLFMIIVLHKNIKPISQFYYLLRDMFIKIKT